VIPSYYSISYVKKIPGPAPERPAGYTIRERLYLWDAEVKDFKEKEVIVVKNEWGFDVADLVQGAVIIYLDEMMREMLADYKRWTRQYLRWKEKVNGLGEELTVFESWPWCWKLTSCRDKCTSSSEHGGTIPSGLINW
jgi:hypothetical protein